MDLLWSEDAVVLEERGTQRSSASFDCIPREHLVFAWEAELSFQSIKIVLFSNCSWESWRSCWSKNGTSDRAWLNARDCLVSCCIKPLTTTQTLTSLYRLPARLATSWRKPACSDNSSRRTRSQNLSTDRHWSNLEAFIHRHPSEMRSFAFGEFFLRVTRNSRHSGCKNNSAHMLKVKMWRAETLRMHCYFHNGWHVTVKYFTSNLLQFQLCVHVSEEHRQVTSEGTLKNKNKITLNWIVLRYSSG